MEENTPNTDPIKDKNRVPMAWRKSGLTPWIEKRAGRRLNAWDRAVGIILIVIFLFAFYVVLDANKYKMMVNIVEGAGKVGVNPTTESLDFGDLSRGTSAVRRVNIVNGTFMPVYVMAFKTGDISDLVDIDRNNFKLGSGEEAKIEFASYIPASAEIGRIYNGRVYLFKIPTFGL